MQLCDDHSFAVYRTPQSWRFVSSERNYSIARVRPPQVKYFDDLTATFVVSELAETSLVKETLFF